jgi:CRISPR system Cascade subunit CasE
MFLSKVEVNWKWARDPYQVHRAIWHLFPDRPEAERDFLFRIEQMHMGRGAILLVQSAVKPQDSEASKLLVSKEIDLYLPANTSLRFRLRANPVKTIKDERERLNIKGEVKRCRVPLVHEEQQLAWLKRKFDGAAHFSNVQATSEPALYFRKGSMNGKVQPICFDGTLSVADPDHFHKLLSTGIGPAKSIGCGLLSIARA